MKEKVHSLANDCENVEEMVDKLQNEKEEAVNGNFDQALKRKIAELEKVGARSRISKLTPAENNHAHGFTEHTASRLIF